MFLAQSRVCVGGDRVGCGQQVPKHRSLRTSSTPQAPEFHMMIEHTRGFALAPLIFLFCFALCGAVRAEEQDKGWLGATVKDISAKDAAKLGMESPHGDRDAPRCGHTCGEGGA